MNNETMIENIRALCKENNITPTRLEEVLGFSQGLISRWKDKTPSLDRVVDIADYFHISLDELVGYNQNINDEFLSILMKLTEEKTIKWFKVNSDNTSAVNFCGSRPFLENEYKELQYYSQYKDSYFIIYCFCECEGAISPMELYLYIQPSKDTSAVSQKYTLDDLKPLWIKILKSLDEDAPDEIKAEDLKNSFINEFSKPKQPQKPKKNVIFVSNISDKHLVQIMPLKGSLLYELNNGTILDRNEVEGVTMYAKEFYYKHKETLGKIIKAYLKNGEDLVFISENYYMKLSGFSWGKDCGMTGYNGLIEVLNDAGFDTSDHTVFDRYNLVLTPIK